MADLPITSDAGATPIVVNDPTTTANVANVKAASTAAVAADNSLVVALSPNSPVPTGTNNIGVTGVAQGSTTSGEHGDLVQGAVTTSAPSYSTGQTSPLSLTTAGDLRTVAKLEDGSGTAITSTAINLSQALDVNLPDRTATISLTAVAQTSQVSMAGKGSVAFVLTSMGTGGQVICEGSLDGATWQGMDVWQESQESWVVNGALITTADQYWVEPIGALWFIRVRVTALSSGTITGLFYVSSATMGTYEFQGSSGTNLPNNILLVGGKTNDATPQFQPIPLTIGGTAVSSNIAQVGGNTVSTAASGILKVGLADGSGNSITSTAVGSDQALDIATSLSADGLAAFDNTVFTTSFSFNLPTSGTESPAVYIKNPNGSGKTLVIKRIHVAPITAANALATVRIYSNPTTSANGTSQTASTTSIGSGATAVATPFSGPTASANGAQLFAFAISSAADGTVNNVHNFDGLIRVIANNTLLITGNPTSNNLSVVWTVIWQEV